MFLNIFSSTKIKKKKKSENTIFLLGLFHIKMYFFKNEIETLLRISHLFPLECECNRISQRLEQACKHEQVKVDI